MYSKLPFTNSICNSQTGLQYLCYAFRYLNIIQLKIINKMKTALKTIALATTTFLLFSCSSEDNSSSPIVDEILKGNVTSIGRSLQVPIASKAVPTKADAFLRPSDVVVDQNGDLYIADSNDKKVKKVVVSDGTNTITDVAGNDSSMDEDGTGSGASFHFPQALAFSKDYKTLYVGTWRKIRAIDIATSQVTTLAGSGVWGDADGVGVKAEFAYPTGIVVNNSGTMMYVSENISGVGGGTQRVRKIDLATKQVTTMAFNNLPTEFSPAHMVIDNDDKNLYIANYKNVLQVNLDTNNVTVIAGSTTEGSDANGVGVDARFTSAYSLAFSPNETYLYVNLNNYGDRGIKAINMDTKEVISVVFNGYGFEDGDASTAKFQQVLGVSYDKVSNKLYAVDALAKAIRVIE